MRRIVDYILVVLAALPILANGCIHTFENISGSLLIDSSGLHLHHRSHPRCHFIFVGQPDSPVSLNLSLFYGFKPPLSVDHRGRCLPRVEITHVMGESPKQRESPVTNVSICHNQSTFYALPPTPLTVKLTFKWLKHKSSGFHLVYNFRRKQDSKCPGNTDKSCLSLSTTPSSSGQTDDNVVAHVIPAVLVVIVFIVVVVVLGLRLTRHNTAHDNRLRQTLTSCEQSLCSTNQLSTESEVVYRTSEGHSEGAMLQGDEAPLTNPSSKPETQFPPHIARSLDGEEGYAKSQRALGSHPWHGEGKIYGPPPNRTIFEGESPPPYRSHCGSLGEKSSSSSKSSSSHFLRDTPRRYQHHPMSSNNNNNSRNSNLNTSSPRALTPTQEVSGSHPFHNLTVYGHPPRTGFAHHTNHLQQQISPNKQQSLPQLFTPPSRTQASGAQSPTSTNRHSNTYSSQAAVASALAASNSQLPPTLDPPPNYSDIVTNSNNRTQAPDSPV